MEALVRKKESEVQAIKDTVKSNDVQSSEILRKALQRADLLQKQIESGAVDVHTQALLVDSYLNKNAENEMLRQQIIEEVKAKMLRDKEDQRYKNEEIV